MSKISRRSKSSDRDKEEHEEKNGGLHGKDYVSLKIVYVYRR